MHDAAEIRVVQSVGGGERRAAGALALGQLYAPIVADLQATRAVIRDELVSDQGFICELIRHVEQFHGKMVRPAVLLLAARAAGGIRPEHHTLAGVVEIVHIATLVHDDVLDESDIRRRAATVNRLWGNERAVLLGDYLISHAYHLCSSLESQYAARLVGRTTNTVCEGEMMQVSNRGNFELTPAEYFDIIERKTAVLIGTSCELGAHYAGASAAVTKELREFGINLGIAFQIVDDLLDLTGQESLAGKSLGRDVDMGKLTLPMIHHLGAATPEQRTRLLSVMRGDDPQRYREVVPMLAETQSVEYARQIAGEYVRAAQRNLDVLRPSDAKESLAAMAEFVLVRNQ